MMPVHVDAPKTTGHIPVMPRPSLREQLLSAGVETLHQRGFNATSVQDITDAAGAPKGSFYNHFKSKEQLGVAAAEQFGTMAGEIFGSAPYRQLTDPRDRVLGYVDFRAAMLQWEIGQYTCLLGTMVQEVYATHPEVRDACNRQMSEHVGELVKDLEAAKQLYAPDAPWSAESVGYFMQAVLQGAFVFAKAKQGPEVATECLQHLRRYLETLFPQAQF